MLRLYNNVSEREEVKQLIPTTALSGPEAPHINSEVVVNEQDFIVKG